jgi:glycerophosphoryl diester phosphodiesterase
MLRGMPIATQSPVLAIGHRGAAGHMPENTMPSFEKALLLGADALEFDVALTRDGVPVVIHDDTLDRTTDASGVVEAVAFERLRTVDAGSWRGLRAHLPSLDEVLGSYSHRTLLNLEIKLSTRRAELVDACAQAVVDHRATDKVIFSSFDHDALRLLRYVLPQARIGVLSDSTNLEASFACARDVGAENIHPPVLLVSGTLATRAHEAGLKVWTWTANSAATIAQMIACGVDGIFSDFPERVIEARG